MLAGLAVVALSAPAHALTITPIWDATITSDPQAATIQATINAAISEYTSRITDPGTLAITFSEFTSSTLVGGSSKKLYEFAYSSVLAALRTHAGSVDDATALGHLPDVPNNPVNFNAAVSLTGASARALGLLPAAPAGVAAASPLAVTTVTSWLPRSDADLRANGIDPARVRPLSISVPGPASVSAVTSIVDSASIQLYTAVMNLSPAQNDTTLYSLYTTAQHEIDECLASWSALNNLNNNDPLPTGAVSTEDLFRYDPRGNRSFSTKLADTAYFSFDGTARLARFNQAAGGDFSDWWSAGARTPQVQDAKNTRGSAPAMGVEWRMLDVLGFNYGGRAVWVDFNYIGVQTGEWATPWSTLAAGMAAVPAGGTVIIKGNGYGHELLTLSKPATITSSGGVATIGQ